ARLSVIGLDPAQGLRAVAVATAGEVRVGRLARVLMESVAAHNPLPIAVFPPEKTVFDVNAFGEVNTAADAAGDPWREAAFAVALTPDPADQESAKEVAPVDYVPAGSAPAHDDDPPVAADAARHLRSRLAALAPGLGRDRVAVGLSDRFTGEADLHSAIEEARLAMRLAMRRPGRLELAEHDELASHLVLLAHVPDELRRAYRERLLGPLRTYDARHHSQLEETLDRFLCSSVSWSRCAQELHIHVNTLRYRIDKINQLTGRDLARLDHQVDFYLALRAR
ncbi:MAG: PucR family transcriptional regulator, partial [Actinocrinis sp.]